MSLTPSHSPLVSGITERRLLRVLAFALIALALMPWAARAELPDRVQAELVRFQLLTGKPLDALSANPDPANPEERLLRARALTELGLHDAAYPELESLAYGDTEFAGEAGLEIVRLAMRAGDLERAQTWLDRVRSRLKGDKREEGLFRQAEILRRQGELSEASGILDTMSGSNWTGLGYYNLATAYAALDRSVTRPLIALRVAAATVGEQAAPASADLVNYSNLGGGLLALLDEDYDKALGFLDGVSLDSYQAPQALYLHGVAHFRQNNVRGALQSWQRARQFPLALPGAPESRIAMGQGFEEAGAMAQAADAFLEAQAAFESERVLLDEMHRNLAEEGADEVLALASSDRNGYWSHGARDSRSKGQAMTPREAWLVRFMEDPQAQQVAERLAGITALDRRLANAQAEFRVIRTSLESRLAKARDTAGNSSGARLADLTDRLERLDARARALQDFYDQALADGRIEALASPEMKALFDRLGLAGEAAEQHGDADMQERVRRLRGLTLWDIQTRYGQDRPFIEETLASSRAVIDRSREKLNRLARYADDAPARFQALLGRIDAAEAGLARQRERLADLQIESDNLLRVQLQQLIQAQIARLTQLQDRSEQEVAHLYEAVVLGRLQPGQSQEAAQ